MFLPDSMNNSSLTLIINAVKNAFLFGKFLLFTINYNEIIFTPLIKSTNNVIYTFRNQAIQEHMTLNLTHWQSSL